ncbi:Prefoldin [Mycotypha africana]|uniref:Prefoldin n=1 Tax=Mycotypha africana TaxID=64632 RepID=UPI002300ACFE|nr:Prefoldin [Mycotypha africana]KAI8991460.1 Prefoldin [Mycotypha africana]
MSALADETIRRVFVELQNKYIQSQQQAATVKAQITAKQRERKLAELTRRELDGLDEDTNTYKPVGKMFIQSPLSEMKNEYVRSISQADEEIKKLEKSHKYFERAATDAQANLKDILQGPRT